jgi:hypothetical protein
MNKYLKYFLYFAGALLALFVLVLVYVLNERAINLQWNALFYEPPTQIRGIEVGMHERDVVFLLGKPLECREEDGLAVRICFYALANKKTNDFDVRYDNNGRVNTLAFKPNIHSWPFRTVEEMEYIFGKEDILGISKDFEKRRYTYLKWGVTFRFSKNRLSSVVMGEVQYRAISDGSYFVKDRQFCPSENCPYDEEGNMKPEFKGKDYRYLLSLPAD